MNYSLASHRRLAIIISLVATAYAVLYRFLPMETKALLLLPLGAMALYAGARVRPMWLALVFSIGPLLLTDVIMNFTSHYPPNYAMYPVQALSMFLGRWLLSTSHNPWRIAGGAVLGYAVFFLASNFVAWIETAREYYRPHTFQTLLLSYREGLEFLRQYPGQLYGDLIASFLLFGAHYAAARAFLTGNETSQEVAR